MRCRLLLPCFIATVATAAEPTLPKPHYDFEPNDPAWLKQAVQFHGHLGPWAAAGLRMGMAGKEAVGADGYFDVEVVAEGPFAKPPTSCFLDGVQVATGATWGKRNIESVKAETIVLRVKNIRNGRTAEVRPTPEMLKLATSFKPTPKVGADDDHKEGARQNAELEAIARKIARLPANEILTVTMGGKRE
jgi:formylmethanofuran dehydrogenase subunit E